MKKFLFYLMALPSVFLFVACGDDGDDDPANGGGNSGNSIVTVVLTSANLTDDGYFDGLMYYKISSNSQQEVTVNKAEKSAVTVEIPSVVKIDGTNYKCTSIFKDAFSDCRTLASITIPGSITNIGANAFAYCYDLKKVIVKDLVAWYSISFSGNSSNPLYYAEHLYSDENTEITNLVIPNGVTSISDYAFRGCSGLTSVTIPNSVTSIGYYAFSGCSSLTSVTIPNSVTSIGYYAFRGCSGLTSVTIPNSVTSIGDSAFEDCYDLKKVIVNDLAAWCSVSFSNYSSNPLSYAEHLYSDENTEITNLVIPNGVTSNSDYAFRGCSGLTSVTIPNGMTSISDYAFAGCSSLTSIVIPNSVTSIGNYALGGCSSLTSIVIPNSVKSIGREAFSYCSSLTSIHCKAAVPPSVYYLFENIENNQYYRVTLYVPKGTLETYKSSYGWGWFENIVEE